MRFSVWEKIERVRLRVFLCVWYSLKYKVLKMNTDVFMSAAVLAFMSFNIDCWWTSVLGLYLVSFRTFYIITSYFISFACEHKPDRHLFSQHPLYNEWFKLEDWTVLSIVYINVSSGHVVYLIHLYVVLINCLELLFHSFNFTFLNCCLNLAVKPIICCLV